MSKVSCALLLGMMFTSTSLDARASKLYEHSFVRLVYLGLFARQTSARLSFKNSGNAITDHFVAKAVASAISASEIG